MLNSVTAIVIVAVGSTAFVALTAGGSPAYVTVIVMGFVTFVLVLARLSAPSVNVVVTEPVLLFVLVVVVAWAGAGA